jgi:hypothetical protein
VVTLQPGDSVTVNGAEYTLESWRGDRGSLVGFRPVAHGAQASDVLEVDRRTGAVSRHGAVVGHLSGDAFRPA